jgi:hypothetical protein
VFVAVLVGVLVVESEAMGVVLLTSGEKKEY